MPIWTVLPTGFVTHPTPTNRRSFDSRNLNFFLLSHRHRTNLVSIGSMRVPRPDEFNMAQSTAQGCLNTSSVCFNHFGGCPDDTWVPAVARRHAFSTQSTDAASPLGECVCVWVCVYNMFVSCRTCAFCRLGHLLSVTVFPWADVRGSTSLAMPAQQRYRPLSDNALC